MFALGARARAKIRVRCAVRVRVALGNLALARRECRE